MHCMARVAAELHSAGDKHSQGDTEPLDLQKSDFEDDK